MSNAKFAVRVVNKCLRTMGLNLQFVQKHSLIEEEIIDYYAVSSAIFLLRFENEYSNKTLLSIGSRVAHLPFLASRFKEIYHVTIVPLEARTKKFFEDHYPNINIIEKIFFELQPNEIGFFHYVLSQATLHTMHDRRYSNLYTKES